MTAPERVIAAVNATRSSGSIPRRNSAIASAPTCASDSEPSVIPPTRNSSSSRVSAAPSRLRRMTSAASTERPAELDDQPRQVAGGLVGEAQRLLV